MICAGTGANDSWNTVRGAFPLVQEQRYIHPTKHGGPGTRSWQWSTFTGGHSMNAVFRHGSTSRAKETEDWVTPDDSRTMQAIARYTARVDLERMKPRNDLSSTQYCLADPSQTYIVYQPAGNSTDTSAGVPFTLKVDAGDYQYEWFDPETIRIARQGRGGIHDYLLKRWNTFRPERELWTMWDIALVEAILRPELATAQTTGAPIVRGIRQVEQFPDNLRRVTVWADIDEKRMLDDFWRVLDKTVIKIP